uniref:Uncharacterized protein n=1 Tax=Leishmania guyanensis TaxID=5670 RepID=A0A1E1IQV5_LEIGU|nr:Hypothetical protein BN36_1111450 [Leishmania guyanensis]
MPHRLQRRRNTSPTQGVAYACLCVCVCVHARPLRQERGEDARRSAPITNSLDGARAHTQVAPKDETGGAETEGRRRESEISHAERHRRQQQSPFSIPFSHIHCSLSRLTPRQLIRPPLFLNVGDVYHLYRLTSALKLGIHMNRGGEKKKHKLRSETPGTLRRCSLVRKKKEMRDKERSEWGNDRRVPMCATAAQHISE